MSYFNYELFLILLGKKLTVNIHSLILQRFFEHLMGTQH